MNDREIVRYLTEQRILDAIDMRIFLIGENSPRSYELRKLAGLIRRKLEEDISSMSRDDFERIDEIRMEFFS